MMRPAHGIANAQRDEYLTMLPSVLQYYDPNQAICVSTPACFGGSCPACTYLDPSCQCCKSVSGCGSPSPSGK